MRTKRCCHTHCHHTHQQSKYVVLSKPDLKRQQVEVVEAVTSVLGISSEDAARILRKYKWCVC